MRHVVPSSVHFAGPLAQRWHAEKILSFLVERGLWRSRETPVVLYCFSNGGCM